MDEIGALELLVLEVVVVVVVLVILFDKASNLGLARDIVDADRELAVRFSIQPGDKEVSLALSDNLRAFDLTNIAFVGGGRPERVALPNGAQENQEANAIAAGQNAFLIRSKVVSSLPIQPFRFVGSSLLARYSGSSGAQEPFRVALGRDFSTTPKGLGLSWSGNLSSHLLNRYLHIEPSPRAGHAV